MFEYNWPLIAGACLAIILGEIMVNRRRNSKPAKTSGKTTKSKNC